MLGLRGTSMVLLDRSLKDEVEADEGSSKDGFCVNKAGPVETISSPPREEERECIRGDFDDSTGPAVAVSKVGLEGEDTELDSASESAVDGLSLVLGSLLDLCIGSDGRPWCCERCGDVPRCRGKDEDSESPRSRSLPTCRSLFKPEGGGGGCSDRVSCRLALPLGDVRGRTFSLPSSPSVSGDNSLLRKRGERYGLGGSRALAEG